MLQQKHPSIPYNPLLAAAFFRAGYIEAWGRGIEKINHEFDIAGVQKPDYNYEFAGLMITFQEDIKGKTRVETRVEKTKLKTPDLILDTLSAHPNMTLANVAKRIGRSLSTVERAASKLVKEGTLRRVRPKKGGSWEITMKNTS